MEARHRSPLTGAVTAVALVFLFVPLAVVVLFSFHRTAGLSFPFEGFSLRWYREVFASEEFTSALRNSLVVAVSVAVITLLLGTAAAYGITRSSSRLRGPLAVLFFTPITLPGLFVGLALLVFFTRIEIGLSLTTVAIAHLVYVFPYFLVIARVAFERLDVALEEAAADLGATPWQVFRRVTLPAIWPVLLGGTCLAFVLSLDEFVITFFVVGSDATLPLYIFSSLRTTIDPSINTVSTLLMGVTVAVSVLAFVATVALGRRRTRQPLVEALVAGA